DTRSLHDALPISLNKKGSSKSGSFLLKSSKAKSKLEVCNNPNTVNKYTELRIIAILFLKKLRMLVFIFPSNNHKTPMQISPSVMSGFDNDKPTAIIIKKNRNMFLFWIGETTICN